MGPAKTRQVRGVLHQAPRMTLRRTADVYKPAREPEVIAVDNSVSGESDDDHEDAKMESDTESPAVGDIELTKASRESDDEDHEDPKVESDTESSESDDSDEDAKMESDAESVDVAEATSPPCLSENSSNPKSASADCEENEDDSSDCEIVCERKPKKNSVVKSEDRSVCLLESQSNEPQKAVKMTKWRGRQSPTRSCPAIIIGRKRRRPFAGRQDTTRVDTELSRRIVVGAITSASNSCPPRVRAVATAENLTAKKSRKLELKGVAAGISDGGGERSKCQTLAMGRYTFSTRKLPDRLRLDKDRPTRIGRSSDRGRVKSEQTEVTEVATPSPGAARPRVPEIRFTTRSQRSSSRSARSTTNGSSTGFLGPVPVQAREKLKKITTFLSDDDVFARIDSVTKSEYILVTGENIRNLICPREICDEIVNASAHLFNYRFFAMNSQAFFSTTWFYTILGGGNGVDGPGGKFDFDRLNRWKRPYNLGELDWFFAPINHGNVHWTLAAVDFKNKRILHIDSLRSGKARVDQAGDSEVIDFIREWVKLTFVEELGSVEMAEKTGIDTWDGISTGDDYAQQEDAVSCGVFMIATAICLAAGKGTKAYGQRDIMNLRFRLAQSIRERAIKQI